jgi:hypothetical protein
VADNQLIVARVHSHSPLFGCSRRSAGFPRSAYWLDGKIPKQNAEKIFTVRFTVKTIRLGATDGEWRRTEF